MLYALRHLLSILILPFTVTVVVPRWILRSAQTVSPAWPPDSALTAARLMFGAALVAAGLTLMFLTIRAFFLIGRGTLAPWDPPRRLVVVGVYRHVRNPMISGVLTILLGESVLSGAPAVFEWFLFFLALNCGYIPLVEEPGLELRFGDDYARYKKKVPRWIPRLEPWDQSGS